MHTPQHPFYVPNWDVQFVTLRTKKNTTDENLNETVYVKKEIDYKKGG